MSAPDPATALAALRTRVLARGCPDGRRPVFGTGSVTPRLCIVGEGPAERDESTGRPFSGPAGALLERALAEAGADPATVWLTNVLKCRAVVRREGRWVNRPPTDAELAAALPLLHEELAILRPPVMLCLGATAARALLGKGFTFSRDRGRWFPLPAGPRVLATYLPAYVLRREGPDFDAAYAAMLGDIRTAVREA
jgi:uracil-DNA glycosylase family 4